MNKKRFLPVIIGMIAMPLCAQQMNDSTHVFELGEVDVLSGRNRFRSDSIGSAFMRSADMQNAADALNWVPGVSVTEAGNRGEAGFILRGISSNAIPIYIDGVPMTAAYDGTIDLYRLPVGMLSKIDVSKSSSSLLLGGNTFGPSINLISRRPVKPLELHFDVNTLWHSNLNIGGRWGRWFAQADVSWSYEPDFHIAGDASDYDVTDKTTGETTANPYLDGKKRLHSSRHDFSLNVKAGYEPNATDKYVVGYTMIRASKDVPPTLGFGKVHFRKYTDWDKDEVYFHSSTKLSSALNINTKLYYDRFYNALNAYDDFTYSTMERRSSFRSIYDDYTLGAHAGLDWTMRNSNTLKFGANYKYDVHRSHNEGDPTAKISEGEYSFIIEDNTTWNRYWSTVVSLGYFGRNGYKSEQFGKQDGVKGNHLFEMDNTSDNEMNELIAIDYHPSKIHHLRLTVSNTSRFARMKDRYSYKLGRQIPNPDLGTEKSNNIDLTYEGQLNHWNWMVSAYYNWISDVIMEITGVDADDAAVWQNQNRGKAQYRGFELGGGYDNSFLTAGVSYACINQVNKSDKSLHFLYVPKNKVNVFVEIRPIWKLRLQGRFIAQSRSYATTDGSAWTAGFGRLDISLARKIWKCDVKIGALNVTNKRYEYTAGYPERRCTVYGSVSFDL